MPSDDVTFRLSISDPKSIDMTELARSLERKGFRVTPDGRRGFMLTATQDLTERFFQTEIQSKGDSHIFATEPTNESVLKDVSYRVYFPTRPEYFP